MENRGRVPPEPEQTPRPRAPQPYRAPVEGRPAAPLPYEGIWRFTAPALESSVPQARHAVRELLRNRRVPAEDDVVHGLLVIVSELVTNAVRHAAVLSPQITVVVSVGADWIRVAVEDHHPYKPKALVADQGQTGGRGLLLVKTITAEAGGSCDVESTDMGGKVIWAALPMKIAAAGPTG